MFHLAAAAAYNPEAGQHLHKSMEDLPPVCVLDLFTRIMDEDCELLRMTPRPCGILLPACPASSL
jgi:hypothetical protein